MLTPRKRRESVRGGSRIHGLQLVHCSSFAVGYPLLNCLPGPINLSYFANQILGMSQNCLELPGTRRGAQKMLLQ
jgi:hypothetical protein